MLLRNPKIVHQQVLLLHGRHNCSVLDIRMANIKRKTNISIFYFHRCPATFLHYSCHSKPFVLRIYKRTISDLAFTERRKQSLSRDQGREYALKLSTKTVVFGKNHFVE